MSTISHRFEQALFAAAVLLLAGLPLAAQEPIEGETSGETSDEATVEARPFTFRIDPLLLQVLETDVDTDSSKFEEYRDLDSGFRPSFHLVGDGGERQLDIRAEAIGRDDARYTLDYDVAGRYGLLFDFNKIPHRFGNNGHMLWTRTGPGRLEIADPVQAAIEGAVARQFATDRTGVSFGFLNGLLAPYLATAGEVDLGLIRDRALLRLDLGRMAELGWTLEYSHENRKGDRPYGGSFGFNNVTEIPEPIDYKTDAAELAGEWNTERAGLRFGYRYSSFKNDISTLIWDNPFRLNPSTDPNAYQGPSSSSIGGSSLGFADLAPDNQASLLFMAGRARFGGDWFANGSASYNVMTQDDPLLPYTLNPAIVGVDHLTGATPTDVNNLPVRNADNKVNVLNVNAQTGTRFGDSLGLTFRYRLYDYDNQSRRVEIPGYVRFHGVWEEIPRITVPYAYTVQDVGAELGWDFVRNSRIALGYTLQTWDRDFREVESSDEDILKLSFDTQPFAWFILRASYELGDRSIDGYETEAQEASFVDPAGISNQPGLRKYEQAARAYDQLNVQAQFFAGDAWSFFAGVTGRDEDYDESQLGLISDEILQYNVELGYAPGENLNLYLFGHRADRDTRQRGRQSGGTVSTNPLDDWLVDFDEKTDTWGLGATSRFAEKWSTDISGRWSKSDGFADFTAFPGGAPLAGRPLQQALDFANYEDIELLALIGRLDYQITEQTEAGVFYRYEEYTIDSFIRQGLSNYLPGALLLNPEQGGYQANVFGLELKLAF